MSKDMASKEPQFWDILKVFESEVRVEIIRILLQFEWQSLSEIAKRVENKFGWKMTLPGLLKHMRELEDAGIVRHESGIYADKPDARKTIYILEGKERIQKVLKLLEEKIASPLTAGAIFNETSKLARKLQGLGVKPSREERETLKAFIEKCESKEIAIHLTEDEKKKLKLWQMMITME
jgi:DNA-binding transcriptional ArsR family regulator